MLNVQRKLTMWSCPSDLHYLMLFLNSKLLMKKYERLKIYFVSLYVMLYEFKLCFNSMVTTLLVFSIKL